MASLQDRIAQLEAHLTRFRQSGVANLIAGQDVTRWPEHRRDEARLRIELLVAQLERFFTRWAMQGTIEVSAQQAATVLTDVWFPALRAPD